jgi:myo-inositol-1(or 4)-monophosphatase
MNILGEEPLLDRDAALKAAQAAADAAAKSLMTDFRRTSGALNAWMKSPGAVVTEADIRSDKAIAAALVEAGAPGVVISEESVSGEPVGGLTWLVDPLCGTVPFRAGMPHWGVNIALRRYQRLEVAVLDMPASGERLAALQGAGVTRNGEPFSPRDPGLLLSEATIGLEVDRGDWQRLLRTRRGRKWSMDWLGDIGGTNTFASAAYPIGQVCLGRMSGVVFYKIDAVHLAAGALVAQELGALVTDAHGRPLDWTSEAPHEVAVVAWPSVHAELVAAMAGG